MAERTILSLEHISKSFGGVQALDDVTLDVNQGEVHAIVGENGAGKSTLMKIIAGALHPDTGKIIFEDKDCIFTGPRDASQMGIAIVYQEPVYFRELSILENIYMGEELKSEKNRASLDWHAMTIGASEAVARMGLDPKIISKPMNELTLGTQQLVLIARSIHKNVKLLILDEPTAILSQAETDILFKTIKQLKEQDVSILYISHRIEELFQVADRITVLRDGKKIREYTVRDATEEKLITAMTGRMINENTQRKKRYQASNPVILQVQNLARAGFYENVSFEVHKGEVLGLYGLVGAGRSEIVKAIYGEMKAEKGQILYKGRVFKSKNSKEAIDNGIVYVPEDRRLQGLFFIRSISDNLTAGLLRSVSNKIGMIHPKQERALVDQQIKKLAIKTDNVNNFVSSLSGGNQQKVVLGRGLFHFPELLILDEPTHGIDVGTKREIHTMINELADSGIAIILISSDLPEVLSLSDNFLIMHEGTKMGYLSKEEANEESVLRLALGLNGK